MWLRDIQLPPGGTSPSLTHQAAWQLQASCGLVPALMSARCFTFSSRTLLLQPFSGLCWGSCPGLLGYCVLRITCVLRRDGCWRGTRGAQVGALAFKPLFRILGLGLGSETRDNPSPKLEAWSLSKTTCNNPVVLNFGARGNVRLSSGPENFFFFFFF